LILINENSNEYINADLPINEHNHPDSIFTIQNSTVYQKNIKNHQETITNENHFFDKDNAPCMKEVSDDDIKSTQNEITDNAINNNHSFDIAQKEISDYEDMQKISNETTDNSIDYPQSFDNTQEEYSDMNNQKKNLYQKMVYDVSFLMQDKHLNSDEAFDYPVKTDNQIVSEDEYFVQPIESIDRFNSSKVNMSHHMDEIDDTDNSDGIDEE
ncbi:hypothetical protein MHK_001661, partial [Candidatus Magnetomorum sp. HK-1]